MNYWTKNTAATFSVLTVLLALFLAFYPHPPILGVWEAKVLFYAYAPQNATLNWIINPRANIGGHFYASLDFVRILAQTLGFRFEVLRLIPVFYALSSLIVFFVVIRRWFGFGVALFSVALLMTNQTFLTYEHELIVSMVTMLCILLLIERIQKLEFNTKSIFPGIALGAVCAFTALHYGIGRYGMFLLLGFAYFGKDWRKKLLSKTTFVTGITFFLVLGLLNHKNPILFLKITSFLSPAGGDNAVTPKQAIESVWTNLPLVFNLFTGRSSDYVSSSSDLLADIRFQLVSLPVLFLFVVGFVGQFFLKQFFPAFAKSRRFLLYVLVIFLFPPMLSVSQQLDQGTVVSTISNYRLFYSLIGIHAYAGLGGYCIYVFLKRYSIEKLALLAAAVLILHLTKAYVNEVSRFKSFVENYPCTSIGEALQCRADSALKAKYGRFAIHLPAFDEHITFYRNAKLLAEKFKSNLEPGNNRVLIEMPEWGPHPDQYAREYVQFSYHSVFLSLYISQFGIQPCFVQFYNYGERGIPEDYDHKQRKYVLQDPTRVTAQVMPYKTEFCPVYLATTLEERSYITDLLRKSK